jgi:hypothetical protein
MHVPALSKQAAPEDSNVATTLWIAQYDSEMVSLFVLFEHQNLYIYIYISPLSGYSFMASDCS